MKNPRDNQKTLAEKLNCLQDNFTIEEAKERVYILKASSFHEILQKRKITQLWTIRLIVFPVFLIVY